MKINKNDVVIYEDRSGVTGQWDVQAINEAGKLQLVHIETGKVALGVDLDDISENLGAVEYEVAGKLTEEKQQVINALNTIAEWVIAQ